MFEQISNSIAGLLQTAMERAQKASGQRHVSREVDPRQLFEKNPFDVIYKNVRETFNATNSLNRGATEHERQSPWGLVSSMMPRWKAATPPASHAAQAAAQHPTDTRQAASGISVILRGLGAHVAAATGRRTSSETSSPEPTKSSTDTPAKPDGFAEALRGLGQITSGMGSIVRGLGAATAHGVEHSATRAVAGALTRGVGSGLVGAAAGGASGAAAASSAAALTSAVAGGPVGAAAGLLAQALVWTATSVSRNRASIADAAALSGLSGGMQNAFIAMAGADYKRAAERSAYLAPSTGAAIRSQVKFDNEMAQWSMRWAEFQNTITKPYVDIFAKTLQEIRTFYGFGDELHPKIPLTQLSNVVRDLSRGKFAGQKFPPLPPQNNTGRSR